MSKSALFTNDAGKVITEIIGLSTTGTSEVSAARITVPGGITNTPERNDFIEVVLPTKRERVAEVDGKMPTLRRGVCLMVQPNTTFVVSTQTDTDFKYWSVCAPMFRPNLSHAAPA
jgi:probable rRNA maturation factor